MIRFFQQIGKGQLMSFVAILWTLAAIALFFGVGNPSDQVLEKVFSIIMMIMSYLFGKNMGKNEKVDNQ